MVTRFGWGEGASPTLYGDSLVVNWDHEGRSFLTALDTKTGKTRWKVDRDEVSSWATPLVTPYHGGVQIVVNATKRTRGYDLATGKVLWQCGGQSLNVIPSPVRFDDTAIAMSGFQGTAAYAIPLGSSGDITGTDKIAWHYKTATPYVPSPLVVGDRLYFTKWFSPILTCLDARTGKVLMEAQRRFQLLEKQLDLPANRVQLDHVAHAQPTGVRHQDFHVVRGGSFQILFRCRKDEPDLPNGVDLSSFLVDVVRPGFRFRPDPMRRQTPIDGVLALRRSKPDGLP